MQYQTGRRFARSATTFGPYAGLGLGKSTSPVPFLLATGTWCRVSDTPGTFFHF
jgi:hypothetical protein